MRAFVLSTGRAGSTGFAKACSHATNYTAGHETRRDRIADRLDYPDQHIESDNRLCWFLGPLASRFPDAFYVHLTRNRDAVIRSFLERTLEGRASDLAEGWRRARGHYRPRITDSFNHGILQITGPLTESERREAAGLLVDTMNANVSEFLRDKPHMVIDISEAAELVGEFWQHIGAEGDIAGALSELSRRHNAGY